MRNVRRHLGQLQGYLDTAIEDTEACRWNGVTGVLLCPAHPPRAEAMEAIERQQRNRGHRGLVVQGRRLAREGPG
jgi:hypothetical protein